MVVIIVERVSPSVRGELSRWLIQPKAGVYVGRLTARVRDGLRERIRRDRNLGAALLIYRDATEQGFSVRSLGDTSRAMTDFEGLILPKSPVS